jgi:ABC-2 type transport system permease protein/oleandomycin transport system permease protein
MSATATVARPVVRRHGRLGRVARDTYAVAVRNLIAYKRVPQLLVFSTIQPVMFVLLWRYVFGGAVKVPGGVPYVDFLMPGIFVQTVVFGSLAAAIGLAADLKSGLLERFRSLPMASSAVLAGRTFADLARNVLVVALMVAVGFAVGFHIHNGWIPFAGGMVLVLLFGYAMAWIFAAVGLIVGDPESAQAAAFPVLAPLVFASSAFVPLSSMPGWLQAFSRNQPVSITVEAVRGLVLGGPVAAEVLKALVWMIGIVAVFGPIAVRRYRSAV